MDELLKAIEAAAEGTESVLIKIKSANAKKLIGLVRAADEMEDAMTRFYTTGEYRPQMHRSLENYRRLREGGNSPRESDDQGEDGT